MSETTSYATSIETTSPGPELLDVLARHVSGFLARQTESWQAAGERQTRLTAAFDVACARLAGTADPELGRLAAMRQAVADIPLYSLAAQSCEPAILSRVDDFLARSGSTARLSADAISLATDLEAAVERVETRLRTAETEAGREMAANALSSLGYLVERRGQSVRAIRGRTTVWLEAKSNGRLDLDLSGFSGGECLTERERIEQAFRAKGLAMTRTSGRYHGDPRGGTVAQRLRPLFPVFTASMCQSERNQAGAQKVKDER